MSNLELRIDESSDLSFHAVDFVGIPFAPTVEVEDIVGGHRVSITSMGAEGKKTDVFDVMDGATWLNGNILIGELAEGAVLTTDDAYAAPPKGVSVFGKSTQDGTPTPSSPVPILSVDALTLHASADGTTDYINWPVQIPLSDHIARSLPDGTRDELVLSYIGPSTEHEGLGVFSAELVQRTEHVVIDGSGTETYSVSTAGTYNRNVVVMRAGWINAGHPDAANSLYIAMCDRLEAKNTAYNTWTTPGISGWTDSSASFVFGFPNDVAFSDQATFRTWLASNPLTIDYKLATPVTHDLGTVELPILPNPLTAWADGGSAQPTMQLEYERALSIVIPRIEAQLADMATS